LVTANGPLREAALFILNCRDGSPQYASHECDGGKRACLTEGQAVSA
jgi:hypothetical protein